ncbi:MAG: AAA family ATPase [Candidatus Binatia bacterium]
MSTSPQLQPLFRIDLRAERLWHREEAVAMRPKTWAVLRYLAERPGALVTKEEILDAVWSNTAVSEGILNKSITELRLALGDERGDPRFIQTVPRRGFRWVAGADVVVHTGAVGAQPAAAAIVDEAPSAADAGMRPTPPSAADAGMLPTPSSVVGRELELQALTDGLARAKEGSRRIVFVTGEAGAGKSTLVESFLSRIEGDSSGTLVAHGQCLEAGGQHEPYRPLLEAVERLARQPDVGPAIVSALKTHASSWLRQMPSVGAAAAADETDGSMTPGRMLREIAMLLEEVSRTRPLVVVLEDAHWADLATTDACNLLARRRDPARLMLIVTLRPADALVAQHPVLSAKTELTSRGLATEIPIALFTPAFVQKYLAERCGGLQLDAELASWIHHQTAGNPLFVRILVDDLIQRGVLASNADGKWKLQQAPEELRRFVPDSLRELVEGQVERLGPVERDVIDAAVVLGSEFAPSSIATIAGVPVEQAEETCEGLARRGQVLKRAGRGRDGANRGEQFAVVHSMVQRILHDRIPSARLRRLHLAAAGLLEREHPGREDTVAVKLALHYAMAGDPAQSLAQLQRAADSIQRIPAPREVIVIREQILDLVERNPGLPGHRRELVVATMNLAEARQLAYAVVDDVTKAVCERVIELAVTAEDGRECFLASMGLFSNRFYTGCYEEARDIGRRLLVSAEIFQHPFMIKSAHFAIAGATYRLGHLDEAHSHFEACLEHSASSQQTYGWDFHLMSMSHLALLAVHRGQPDEARRLVREAETHGRRGGGAPDAAVIPLFAYALALVNDDQEAMVRVKQSLAQTDRIGAAAWIERARFVHGLLRSRLEPDEDGVRLMKESLARQARNNLYIDRSAYCALLAAEMQRRGLPGARAIVDEGLSCTERFGERHFETELHRLRDELRG